MRLLGSALKSHLCDQRRRSKVTGLSDLMTFYWPRVFILQTDAKSINVFKNKLNWLKIDSVDQKFNWPECGNFSQDAGMPGTKRVIAFSQLVVKGLIIFYLPLQNFPSSPSLMLSPLFQCNVCVGWKQPSMQHICIELNWTKLNLTDQNSSADHYCLTWRNS
jgi:hypothetical protein